VVTGCFVNNADSSAGFAEFFCHALTDAGSAAGDHNNFILKHMKSSLLFGKYII
jgi:hypothetical protein